MCVVVAGGREAEAVTSLHPSENAPWKRVLLGRGGSFGVACQSTSLCVIVGEASPPSGMVWISTHPTGNASAWKAVRISG